MEAEAEAEAKVVRFHITGSQSGVRGGGHPIWDMFPNFLPFCFCYHPLATSLILVFFMFMIAVANGSTINTQVRKYNLGDTLRFYCGDFEKFPGCEVFWRMNPDEGILRS